MKRKRDCETQLPVPSEKARKKRVICMLKNMEIQCDLLEKKGVTKKKGAQFQLLLRMVGPKLEKQHTHIRTPISSFQRLAICLRFLATGSSYAELSYGFRVGKSTVCGIIRETCKELIEVLQPEYLKLPQSHNEWRDIAAGFEYKWQFPNCVGAIDGTGKERKHFP